MTSINPVYVVAPQQQSQKNRTAAHIGNAAVATAGLGAISSVANKVADEAINVYTKEVSPALGFYKVTNFGGFFSKLLDKFNKTSYKFCESLGQKLFREGSKLGHLIERFAVVDFVGMDGRILSERLKSGIKYCKTIGAAGVVAAPLVLGILGLAAYKAREINR